MAAKLRNGRQSHRSVVGQGQRRKKATISNRLILKSNGKAVVDGLSTLAVAPLVQQAQTSQGGRTPKAMPVHLSNLAML